MALNSVSEWSTTPSSNVDVGGVGIQGSSSLSSGNDAMQTIMAQLKTFFSDANFTLFSTDAGATAAPSLNLYRNSATPAASDIIGQVNWQGEDSAGNTEDYAAIDVQIDDATSGSEDATIRLRAKVAGTMTTLATFSGSGTLLQDVARRVGVLVPHENLKSLYVSASTFTVTADALVLFNSSGLAKRFTTFSTTVDITASGAAGLDTGAEASNTWYYVHGIGKADGTKSVLISTSETTPTLPSGYTFWGLIGAVRNDGSSNFIRFAQQDRNVDATATIVVTGGTATSYTAVSLTAVIPVYAKRIKLDIVALSTSGTNTVSASAASRGSSTTSTYGGEITQSGSIGTNGMRNSGAIVHYGGHECYYIVSGTNAGANLWITGWEW